MLSFTERVNCNKKPVDEAESRLNFILLMEIDPETLPNVSLGA